MIMGLPLCLLTFVLFAQSPPATQPKPATQPPPIPAARQEEISRAMINLQQAQLQYQNYELMLAQSAKKVQEAQATYDSRVAALRKEFNVPENCDLTVDKTWQCPPPASKAKP
jgi:hypothetical protein